MNDNNPSVAAGLAVVLLGVTAVGAAGFALVAPVIGILGAEMLGSSLQTVATVALIGLGVVSLAFAGAAAYAARAVNAGRRIGSLIGLGVGGVLLVAPAVASVSGGWHPALVASYAIGGGLVVTLLGLLGTIARADDR